MNWYNDNDPFVIQWLRNLIQAGHLPGNVTDPRPIQEIQPDEIRAFDQCHFFAGIGGWPLALQLAGWSGPVWTGSCPCQPFSVAGKRGGAADPRHLWPEWFRLIEECRPVTIFGEQVASRDGYAWFDAVQTDLEGVGYTVGMVVSPAAGYGAPHIRHRIYFVADSASRRKRNELSSRTQDRHKSCPEFASSSAIGELAQPSGQGRTRGRTSKTQSGPEQPGRSRTAGFWANTEWLPCTDGKARPVEPGTFPLAHGVPSRVGRLRAYGNAICVPQAVEFVRAVLNS